MHVPAARFRNVVRLAAESPLDSAKLDAILEIGCFVVCVDRATRDEELDALGVMATELRARAGVSSEETPAALAARLAPPKEREAQLARLQHLAARLSDVDSKHLAYGVATALRWADLAESDEEFELDLDLLDALGLSDDEASALNEHVMLALGAEKT